MAEDERLMLALEDTVSTGVRVVGLRVLNYAVGFVASVLIARALGAEGRGLYALPIAMLGIVLALSHVGLEHANVFLAARRVPLHKLWASDAAAAVVVSVLAWAVLAIVRAVGGPEVFGGLPIVWLAVTFVQVPFLLMSLYWSSVLQLGDRFRTAVAATVAGTALQAAIVVPMFLADALTPFRVLLLGWAANGATWVRLLWAGKRAGVASLVPDREVLRRAMAFGVRAQIATLFVFLLYRVDQILVQRQLGFEALGLYSLAVVLAELLFLATEPFSSSLLPHQVRAQGGDDRRLGYATARLSLLTAAIVGAVAWVVAPFGLRLAYGPAFEEATWAFRWLLPGIAALAVQRPLQAVVAKEGRLGLATALNAGALAINIALNLWLLDVIGLVGASVASSVTYVLLGVGYVLATRRTGVAGWRELVPRRADLVRLGAALARRPASTREPGPPRAVFVIGTLDRGGTEGQLAALVTRLAGRGWVVTVLCTSAAGALAGSVRDAGVEVVVGHFRGLTPILNPLPVLRELRGFRQTIRDRHPDVVHTYLYWGNLIGLWAGRRSGAVLLGSQRSLSAALGRRRFLGPWERRAVRWAGAWVCNSDAVRADAIAHGAPPSKAHVILNGVEITAAASDRRSSVTPAVLCIANLIGYKGHDVLLRAFARAKADPRVGAARLVLAGAGPEEERLRVLADELGTSGDIEFLGSTDHVAELLAASMFTVLASRTEGMPNALLESLAHGRAVVATSVGGVPQLLEAGGGVLVPPDDVEALAAAIASLLSDPARARELGERGRRMVSARFGMERMVEETLALYAELLDARGSTAILGGAGVVGR